MARLKASERPIVANLLATARWASLATIQPDGRPLCAATGVAPAAGGSGFLLHLSALAKHTRNLLERPSVSLILGEIDDGRVDPQTLARLIVNGEALAIPRDSTAYAEARATYVARFPDAAQRFEFGDFKLFRLVVDEARFVGGFARAYALSAEDLADLLT